MHLIFLSLLVCVHNIDCVIYGTNQYTEYYPGSYSNILISVPHDGGLLPNTISDRTDENIKRDLNTKQIAFLVRDRLAAVLGGVPHVVVNNLHRKKMDPNRPVPECCRFMNETDCVTAFNDYQKFISTNFYNYINSFSYWFRHKNALILDIHGQAHERDWLELGYDITASRLNQTGPLVNDNLSTLCRLALLSSYSFDNIIRGSSSLGTMITNAFTAASFTEDVVPSSNFPRPLHESYYDGGYISKTYKTCKFTNAVQLEINKSLRNNTDPNFTTKINTLASAIAQWYNFHNLGALNFIFIPIGK